MFAPAVKCKAEKLGVFKFEPNFLLLPHTKSFLPRTNMNVHETAFYVFFKGDVCKLQFFEIYKVIALWLKSTHEMTSAPV